MKHVELAKRFASMTTEVELGFTAEQTRARGRALPQLRHARPHFTDTLCIECDACIDVCPVNCLTIAPNGDEPDAAHAA